MAWAYHANVSEDYSKRKEGCLGFKTYLGYTATQQVENQYGQLRYTIINDFYKLN